MKRVILTLLLALCGVGLLSIPPPAHEGHLYGHLTIPARGIIAEVYTTDHAPDCGCTPTLWNGGKVTVDADLSAVEIGDMADLRGVDGEHLVLECIDIRQGLALLMEPQGDVLVVNGRWVYRFTRL